MLRRLYDWTLEQAARRDAMKVLACVSFIESSVFPIPPDVLLMPMVLAQRAKAWLIAFVCSVASVLGGAAGYAIGFFLFEAVGAPVLDFYGYLERFDDFSAAYNDWGWWIVAGAGFTPFPFKLVTIASGVTQLDFLVFIAASAVSRSSRFFLVAALLYYFGPPIRRFVERYFGLVTALFFALLIGGFVAVRYVL